MYTSWSIDSRKISKFHATRCKILRLKCTKFDFRWISVTDRAGGAYSAPRDPLAGFKEPTREGKGEGRRRQGRGGPENGRETSATFSRDKVA